MTTFVYDGSFEGFLTALFDRYELRTNAVKLVASHEFIPTFEGHHTVVTDEAKSRRVWEGLEKKCGKSVLISVFTVFLSEDSAALQILFGFVCHLFDNPPGAHHDFGNPLVLGVTKMERKVSRERHRMKAFVRFQETADGIFFAAIEPDYNVLPLISQFFKNRFADQQWLIYDLKRNYGIFYNLTHVEEVTLENAPSTFLKGDATHEREDLYGVLWSDYFKATNIEARKNMKLHLRHVPKRYWKYLSEKRPDLG